MGVKPTLLVVGGSNESAARDILLGTIAATAAGGAKSNPWNGTAELMVSQYLE